MWRRENINENGRRKLDFWGLKGEVREDVREKRHL